jgi:hypothetical protein
MGSQQPTGGHCPAFGASCSPKFGRLHFSSPGIIIKMILKEEIFEIL